MNIDEVISQYKQLKKAKKTIEQRLEELRQEIILGLPAGGDPVNGIKVQIRHTYTCDADKVFAILDERGYDREAYTKPLVIDTNVIEQYFYDGILTDSDLRDIRVTTSGYAVVEVGENVQAENESGGERL